MTYSAPTLTRPLNMKKLVLCTPNKPVPAPPISPSPGTNPNIENISTIEQSTPSENTKKSSNLQKKHSYTAITKPLPPTPIPISITTPLPQTPPTPLPPTLTEPSPPTSSSVTPTPTSPFLTTVSVPDPPPLSSTPEKPDTLKQGLDLSFHQPVLISEDVEVNRDSKENAISEMELGEKTNEDSLKNKILGLEMELLQEKELRIALESKVSSLEERILKLEKVISN